MATLQKFKHLASQCAVAGSPTRSPTASPVIHLRRRKTLRMLLNRTDRQQMGRDLPPRQGKNMAARHKLRDLFVSSSPSPPTPKLEDSQSEKEAAGERLLPEVPRGGGGRRALRPLSAALRSRLLRRAWRPMLGTIPE